MTPTNTRSSMRDRIEDRLPDDRNIIWAESREREWQCVECGHVRSAPSRPTSCPHCNCIAGDLDVGVNLYIPREACGFETRDLAEAGDAE